MFNRPSLQYRLRGLFITVTVFAVFLGVQVNRANRQGDAMAELEEVTHDVEYDYQRPSEEAPINYARQPRGWPWLRNLLGSHYFDTVVGISLEGTERPVSDRDVALLSQLAHLRYVAVGGRTSITPLGCDSFAHLSRHIRELYLDNVPGEALTRIAALNELRVLWFTHAEVSDAALSSLAKSSSLRELVLNDTSADDAGVASLSNLTSLMRLDLQGTRISDTGLASLGRMDALKSLNLAKTRITDEGLAHIEQISSLRYLDLTETPITDAGVVSLAALRRLHALSVARTRITPDGVFALQRALADCRVDTNRASPEGEEF